MQDDLEVASPSGTQEASPSGIEEASHTETELINQSETCRTATGVAARTNYQTGKDLVASAEREVETGGAATNYQTEK